MLVQGTKNNFSWMEVESSGEIYDAGKFWST